MKKLPQDIFPTSLTARVAESTRHAKHWTPWPYQELGLKIMLENARCGLLLDPGMGKTSITLAAAKVLLRKKLVERVLILAPLRPVHEVWPFERADWEEFHELGMALLHGAGKERALRTLRPEHRVVLLNFDGLPWLMDQKARVKALGADMLVIDESSKVKNTNSQRFKLMRKLVPQFKRRYILTGSPRPRSYEDLFGQVYVLDRGAALGAYVTHFRQRFFYPTGFQMREWALLPGKDKEIDSLIAPMVLRLDAKDYLKLPGTPDRMHAVDLPPAIASEYDKLERTMLSDLFTAPMVSAGAMRSKLCQMANGSVYTDPVPVDDRFPARARPVKTLHAAKADALADLVEELQGEPLLVSIGFHHDVDAIRKALGSDVPCLNSKATDRQAAAIKDAWNRGELPILLGHPASMGHGLNLQKCDCRHVAFYDIPDDFDLYDQFYRRVWRQGNKAQFVFRHHFVARGTVDEAKMINLKRKGSGQRAFLDAMKEYTERKYGKA